MVSGHSKSTRILRANWLLTGPSGLGRHMYSLSEDMDMKPKVSTLAKRLEELEMRNPHEVQAVTEIPMPNKSYFIFQSTKHLREQCPTIPAMREMLVEQANVVGQFKPSTNAPYGNTYNPS